MRANALIFAVGQKGAGKSSLIRRWASQHPRTLWLDAVWEELEGAPAGSIAYDLDELQALLRDRARHSHWRLIFAGARADYPAAVQLLQPVHPRAPGYAQAVGGVTVVCGEADVLAPNNGRMEESVRDLIHRGRHHRVSLFAAARRPAEVARDLSSQADLLVFFQVAEPRDVQWVRARIGDAAAEAVAALAGHDYLLYHSDTREFEVHAGRESS